MKTSENIKEIQILLIKLMDEFSLIEMLFKEEDSDVLMMKGTSNKKVKIDEEI